MQVIIFGVMAFYIFIFIWCVSTLAFLFTNVGHRGVIVYLLPLGIISLAITWGFYRRNIIYLTVAKTFNFALLVLTIWFVIHDFRYSQTHDYYNLVAIIAFGIVQTLIYTRKCKKWFH